MKYNYYDIVDGKLILDNLSVDGSLDLRGCTSLTTLPDNLSVGGSLDLSGCTSLTTLPDNLSVGGWLYLIGCTSLTTLPDNLSVGGELYLIGCTSLTTLPDNLSVGSEIYLRGCTSLNYPIVHSCGEEKRSIWIDYKNKNLINIGCFKGTKKQAIKAIKAKYKEAACDEYIAKVKECFAKAKEVK